jgi:hypothetical protein
MKALYLDFAMTITLSEVFQFISNITSIIFKATKDSKFQHIQNFCLIRSGVVRFSFSCTLFLRGNFLRVRDSLITFDALVQAPYDQCRRVGSINVEEQEFVFLVR